MQILYTTKEVIELVNTIKKDNKTVGFVPTMGALHEGHLSLIKQSKNNTDFTISSIFVNPTQFNDKEDLKRYPRTEKEDAKLLESVNCDYVFIPKVEEIYPEEDTRKFDFGYLDTIMEGALRPGHFNGVAQVVSKLFDIVRPNKAFFGMKDFQQVSIINAMVKQLNYEIEIIPCPIIREKSGLAMSSRNILLDADCKKNSPIIFATLKKALTFVPEKSVSEVIEYIKTTLNSIDNFNTEYVEIVNFENLKLVNNWNEEGKKIICVALFAGNIRLIDNILIE